MNRHIHGRSSFRWAHMSTQVSRQSPPVSDFHHIITRARYIAHRRRHSQLAFDRQSLDAVRKPSHPSALRAACPSNFCSVSAFSRGRELTLSRASWGCGGANHYADDHICIACRIETRLLTSETLVCILRTVVPGVLVTIRETLTAEETPEGSDHAPTPGAYPIMFEGLEVVAEVEATSIDHVEPEPAPRRAQPGAARPRLDLATRIGGPLMADRLSSRKSSPKPHTGLSRPNCTNDETNVFLLCDYPFT